jgi:hypothetical protein
MDSHNCMEGRGYRNQSHILGSLHMSRLEMVRLLVHRTGAQLEQFRKPVLHLATRWCVTFCHYINPMECQPVVVGSALVGT